MTTFPRKDVPGAKKLHPSLEAALLLFDSHPMPPQIQEQMNEIRLCFKELAEYLVGALPNNPATTRGIIDLWRAKNEAVVSLVLEELS